MKDVRAQYASELARVEARVAEEPVKIELRPRPDSTGA